MMRVARSSTSICLLVLVTTVLFLPAKAVGFSKPGLSREVLTPDPPSQEDDKRAALLTQLTIEIRKLRLELLEERLANQILKISQLERALAQARVNRRWLEDQDGDGSQDTSGLNRGTDPRAFLEIDSTEDKAESVTHFDSGRERLPTDRETLLRREAQLTERLGGEQRRRLELLERIKDLKAPTDTFVSEPRR